MPMRFLFDFVSPYAYLAWERLRRVTDVELEPEPVLFAGLLNAHGQKGPAEIEVKRRYVFRDVARRATREGIPVVAPHTHPFNPLLSLRVVCAARDLDERRSLTTALFQATWARGAPVTTEADLRPLLGDAADVLLERAGAPEVKLSLRTNTERAIAAGVFGVPSLLVGSELFWGNDSVEYAIAAYHGTLPALPADEVARWDTLVASASRT